MFGLIAGSLAGWVIVAKVMHLDFRLDLSGALLAAGAAVLLAVLLGLAGTARSSARSPHRTCASYKDRVNRSTSRLAVDPIDHGFNP